MDFTQVPESELGNAAIINETAKKKLALNPALGAKLPDGSKVVGVVKDFSLIQLNRRFNPLLLPTIQEVSIMFNLVSELEIRQMLWLRLKWP